MASSSAATPNVASVSPPHTEASPVGVSREAALHVVKGSLAFTTISGAVGSAIGVLRAEPAMLRGLTYSFNTFAFVFPFFGIREYVVSPLLADAFAPWRDPQALPSLHTRNISSTAISSTLVGGALSGYLRGRSTVIRGATTFAVACTALQFLGNELRVLRVNVLSSSWYNEGKASTAAKHVRVQDSQEHAQDSSEPVQDSFGTSLWNSIKKMSPVQRITEEEYEARLEKHRAKLLEDIRVIDDQIRAHNPKHSV